MWPDVELPWEESRWRREEVWGAKTRCSGRRKPLLLCLSLCLFLSNIYLTNKHKFLVSFYPHFVLHSRDQGKEGFVGWLRGDASRRRTFSRGNAEDCRGDELMNTHHMVNYKREWQRDRQWVGGERGASIWWESASLESDGKKSRMSERRSVNVCDVADLNISLIVWTIVWLGCDRWNSSAFKTCELTSRTLNRMLHCSLRIFPHAHITYGASDSSGCFCFVQTIMSLCPRT